ncbi:hypothetical protein B4096_1832 [Heyndrickxia coagulans]|nr:hypothetical protein B4096_1832 [Heyndrickxia coagulans]
MAPSFFKRIVLPGPFLSTDKFRFNRIAPRPLFKKVYCGPEKHLKPPETEQSGAIYQLCLRYINILLKGCNCSSKPHSSATEKQETLGNIYSYFGKEKIPPPFWLVFLNKPNYIRGPGIFSL